MERYLANDVLEDVGGVDLVFDVIGGDIQKRSAALVGRNAGDRRRAGRGAARQRPGHRFVVEPDRAQLTELVKRMRDGRLRTNIGKVASLGYAIATFNATERRAEKTVIRVR